MGKKEECANSIFSQTWGEYKCRVQEHVIYDPKECENCEDYKKGKPSISKDIPEER